MAVVKIQTGLRVDEATYGKLRTLSEMQGRSLNNLVEFIIRQFLTAYEQEYGPLPERQD